jgi:hypothetical protein
MYDQTAPNLHDQSQTGLAGLRNAVSCELHAQLALRGESIELADVPHVAYAVAVQLCRQYSIEPYETDLADDESLGLDSATFYGSALPPISPDRYPIFDHGWPSTRRPIG